MNIRRQGREGAASIEPQERPEVGERHSGLEISCKMRPLCMSSVFPIERPSVILVKLRIVGRGHPGGPRRAELREVGAADKLEVLGGCIFLKWKDLDMITC